MDEVVTKLEAMFSEEKELNRHEEFDTRSGKRIKPSERAQTARGYGEDYENARRGSKGAKTWEGGQKGVLEYEATIEEEEEHSTSSSDEKHKNKSRGKERKGLAGSTSKDEFEMKPVNRTLS